MIFYRFYNDFREFMYSNKVIIAAAGWTIGAASNTYIQNFMNEIILPLIILITQFIQTYIHHILSPDLFNALSLVFKMLWYTLVWFVSVFMAFFILEYMFNRTIVGVSTNLDKDNKQKFREDEQKAKREGGIIPNLEQIDKILRNTYI